MEHDSMTDKHYGRCPKCASKEIQRSRRRNMFERAISSVMLPWRCNVCYARFFRPFWFKAEPDALTCDGMSKRSRTRRKRKKPRGAHRRDWGSLRWSKQAFPGFIKRNPALAFLVPTRRHVRDVEHTVAFAAKQLGTRPVQ